MPSLRFKQRVVAVALIGVAPLTLAGQGTPPLTLEAARAAAHRASPSLVAAREAATAARARERQAGAYINPIVAYGREQTSGGGQSVAQNIISIDQAIELGGIRRARGDVARARREAADARLALAESDLDFEVARAYALAVAADRRANIAELAARAFDEAIRVSEQRLAAGDIAGYAHRRLRLEAARYATVRAEAMLAARAARVALATLVTSTDAPVTAARLSLSDTLVAGAPATDADSLVALALRSRAELRALTLDAEAAAAGARLAARERTPVPVLTAGFKNESVAQPGGAHQSLRGVVAGISLPLPVFDRRRGSQDAADAEARRLRAEVEVQRRLAIREVVDAHDAYNVAQQQVALLAPALGAEARAALTSAEVAHAEGEITLVEWLDAVRAYREAESSFASLQGELLVRRAALERAVGAPLTLTTGGARSGAPQE